MIGYSQAPYGVPFEYEYVAYPFFKSFSNVKELKIETFTHRGRKKFEFSRSYIYHFDTLGRSIYAGNVDSLQWNSLAIIGYDSMGCPEYKEGLRGNDGWVRLRNHYQNHCMYGQIDTVRLYGESRYSFNSIGQIIRVEEVRTQEGPLIYEYRYDSLGRIQSLRGFEKFDIEYAGDSALQEVHTQFDENFKQYYLFGEHGFPVQQVMYSVRGRKKREQLEGKTTFSYKFR